LIVSKIPSMSHNRNIPKGEHVSMSAFVGGWVLSLYFSIITDSL
jgi:hypothetical protein